MIRILLLTLSLLFTQELEVQGDLKVSGSIDAQNNPVKNVGTPQSLADAINGNVLQDALRDDGVYEYKMIHLVMTTQDPNTVNQTTVLGYFILDESSGFVNSNLLYGGTTYINQLSLDGWSWFTTLGSNIAVFRRPIED